MYEMNCGSCGNVMRTSFVRYGAVATCSKCASRFPVNSQTTRRVAAVAVSADADLLPGPAGAGATGPAISAAGGAAGTGTGTQAKGNAVGNSVINPGANSGDSQSGVGAERASSRPVRRPAQPPRVGQGSAQPVAAAPEVELAKVMQDERRTFTRHPPRGRRVQKLLLLGVILMGVLGMVVASRWFLKSDGHVNRVQDDSFYSLDPTLQLVPVKSVERPVWELSEDPLPDLTVAARVRFENQTILRVGTGQVMLQGALELDSFEIYEECVLHLRLVDREGRIFAKMRLPLMALNGQKPRHISIDLPPELFQRMEGPVQYNAEASQSVFSGAAFEQVVYVATPSPAKDHTALQITTYNPLSRPISRALFVITAYNSAGQSEGQWTATSSQPVDAKQRIEFAVLLPVSRDSEVKWDITGAGIAAVEE